MCSHSYSVNLNDPNKTRFENYSSLISKENDRTPKEQEYTQMTKEREDVFIFWTKGFTNEVRTMTNIQIRVLLNQ